MLIGLIQTLYLTLMLKVGGTFSPLLTTLLAFGYRTPQNPGSFQRRITKFQKYLDRYDRKFQIRPPDLSNKNQLTFPITIPLRVRHIYNPKKLNKFVDNSSTIHWNRLTPNQILLGLQNIEYLDFNQMLEGLRYLSEVPGQQKHDWNSHPWVSKAMNRVNQQFNRVKKGEHIKMYYLLKKLKFDNQDFWKKIYGLIQQNVYDLYPSELETFFMRYYKVCDQYFSPQMKDKFFTMVQGRLRNFSPEGIVNVYQILQQENKLTDFFNFNVFVPLFKSQTYTYTPKDLHRIFKFMLVLGHEKDDRLYKSLYSRLKGYQTLTEEELDNLEEVILEIKDLFITHRVDTYIEHLKQMRIKMKEINSSHKKQIPIQELVRQDLIFFLHQRKLKAEESHKQVGVAR